MVTPRWDAEFPADVRAIVEPVLLRWLPLLPTWCQEFRVRYRGDNANTAQVNVSHRNRWAILTIAGNWLSEPRIEREEAIIHELIHVALEPCWSAASRFLEDVTQDGTPLREFAHSALTDGLECSVDDLARSIQRLIACRHAPAGAS